MRAIHALSRRTFRATLSSRGCAANSLGRAEKPPSPLPPAVRHVDMVGGNHAANRDVRLSRPAHTDEDLEF